MKQKIAFALLMGLCTTGIISLVLVSESTGFSAIFLSTWLRSWGMAYVVVVPVILIVGPRVQWLVDTFFGDKG